MTDRDRLIELIKQGNSNTPCEKDEYRGCAVTNCDACVCEGIADHLIANGVIVPTFNCGDRVWFIPKGLNEVCEATVIRIEYNYFTSPQEWLVIEYFSSIVGKHEYKSRIDLMLNKTVFLTKEEAENALVTDTNVGSKKEREG